MDEGTLRTYSSRFADVMEMRAPVKEVSSYLDAHQGWFRRCAAPMQVAPLGINGYRLTLGRFGNFGFEVEPTIGLRLLPQQQQIYRIETIELEGADDTLKDHYEVDFQARMELAPWAEDEDVDPSLATAVIWDLDLSVWIKLPRVITMLPETLVQSSGDHLLKQIVRQISRRLTWKVQEDFHAHHAMKCPPRRRAAF